MTAREDPAGPVTPWRSASRLRLVVIGRHGDLGAAALGSRLGAGLVAAGFQVVDRRIATSDDRGCVLPRAAIGGCDILMVDLGTEVSPAAVAELRSIADRDPMLVAVMPRFAATREDAVDALRPDISYAALPDRRCLYLKGSVLRLFADPHRDGAAISPAGITAELLRLNRFGFRVGTANRALALHPERARPAQLDDAPAAWRQGLARHFGSAPYRAEALLSGLKPGPDGRRAVAFDLAHIGPNHSGTTRLARAVIGRAAARWSDLALHVVAEPAAYASHFGDLDGRVARADPRDPRRFAAVVRFGQPFLWGELDEALRRAPVLVVFLLDTIGLDCLQHAPDELDALWRFILAEADGVLFNSAFTSRQFERRFAIRPDLPRRVSLHSQDLADYRDGDAKIVPSGPAAPNRHTILLIGNSFPHKHLAETATLLASAGLADPVVVLGLQPGVVAGVTARPSGGLDARHIHELYADAKVVVYPSVYEGFGLPVLEALARGRPVLVRALMPYGEIAVGLPQSVNMHVFTDDADLLRLVRDPPVWIETPAPTAGIRDWNDAADDLRSVLDEAIAGASLDRVVRRIDTMRGRMAFMRHRALTPISEYDGDRAEADAESLDRLAGAVGRFAQSAVLMLGRSLPGRRSILSLAARLLRWQRGRAARR